MERFRGWVFVGICVVAAILLIAIAQNVNR